jgi:prepilin-type processing-associated H-X9-DG protein
MSYGFNAGADGRWSLRGTPLAAIEEPARTLLAADSWGKMIVTKGGPGGIWFLGGDKWTAETARYGVGYRHSDGADFLFFDGHVAWIPLGGLRVQRDYAGVYPDAPYRLE